MVSFIKEILLSRRLWLQPVNANFLVRPGIWYFYGQTTNPDTQIFTDNKYWLVHSHHVEELNSPMRLIKEFRMRGQPKVVWSLSEPRSMWKLATIPHPAFDLRGNDYRIVENKNDKVEDEIHLQGNHLSIFAGYFNQRNHLKNTHENTVFSFVIK